MLGGVLDGVKVLELGEGIPAAFCARLMGDYGAQVIKGEVPGRGDGARHSGPFVGGDPHPDKSIPFLYLNTNKQGVTLNPASPSGRRLLLELVAWADVLVENLPPSYLPGLGLGHETLAQANSALVHTSITPFGQTGPYRDLVADDIVTCAMSGLMYLSGDADKEPLRNGLSQSHFVAGVTASGASLVALFQRMSTGKGGHVDVSITECMATHLVQSASAYAYMGAVRGRRSPQNSGLEEIMPCADGYCLPSAQGSQPWETVAALVGEEGLEDDRFATAEGRIAYGLELNQLLVKGLGRWNKEKLFHASAERRLLFGMVQDAGDLFNCPQLRARDFYTTVEHPVAGVAEYPGEMVRLSEGSYQHRRPAPRLGEHNREVYCDLLAAEPRDLVALRRWGAI